MTAKDEAEKPTGEQQLIRSLAELLNETGLSEIEIEKSGLKIRVARTLSVAAAVPLPPIRWEASARPGLPVLPCRPRVRPISRSIPVP